MSEEKIEQLLAKADDLPVLPHVAMEILNLIEDKTSVPEDFENVIENDQVMTLKILKIANSAYYGYPREIITIKEAIVILGTDTLKSLVLSLLTRQILSRSLDTYGLKKGELWEHSLAVAMVARSISKAMKLANPESYFVAGLLHDVGKLVLDFYLQDSVKVIRQQIREGGLDFVKAEERLLGFDHALIGSKLLEKWNLPAFLVESVRYHHAYNTAPESARKDSYIVDIANRLAYRVAPGSGFESYTEKKVSPAEYGKIGLTSGHIEGILDSVKQSLQTIR